MAKPCQYVHGDFKEGCVVCIAYRNNPQRHAKSKVPAPKGMGLPCIHRSEEPTGELVKCPPCGGNVKLRLYGCAVHGDCTLAKRVDGHGCCDSRCKERVVPESTS